MPTVYSPPVSTYVALATTTLGASASSVTFSSIPASYRDLIVVVDGSTASSTRPVMRLNEDTGSNYTAIMMADDGSGSYSTTSSGTYLDPIPGYSVTGKFSAIWQVMDSGASDKHKTVLVRLNQHDGSHVHASAGRYASNTVVSSLTILTSTGVNYTIGTTFSLFGIEA